MMSKCARVLMAVVAIIGILVTGAVAQIGVDGNIFGMREVSLEDYLPTDVTYDPSIPKPQDVIGFVPGHRHIRHDQLVRYMYAVAEASDRVSIEVTGYTHGMRPLLALTITSPENHRNIETIRERHVALSDPSRSRELNINDMPVVVWHGYSVHGNEPSGANASPLTVYYLAAAQGPYIDRLLRESVIIVDPSINPDGLDRFAHWANMHVGKNKVSDPNHREHLEVWPNGRTNHYWFDLNRDYMPLQHPESQGRMAKYHQWKPNIYNDFHEMGTSSTYFFQPGIPSRNFPLTPERTFELTHKIAEFHATELNAVGSLYYTKESFDDFYIGKGSTYPDLQGSIGILYEQASSRGHVQDSQFGPVTFPFTIKNQFLTTLSTMKAALELRVELLAHQREFFQSAIREARNAPVKGYVFGDPHDPARVAHLLELLRGHEIKIHTLARDVSGGGHTFRAGQSYVIPTEQAQYRFITALFETRTEFTDSLFYDVSTWTLPYAFNIPHSEMTARGWSTALLGEQVTTVEMPKGRVIGGSDAYAYAFEWDGYYAPRMANELMKAGIRLMVASREFESPVSGGSRQFTYGTILLPMGLQQVSAERVYALLGRLSAETGVDVYALETGYSTGGIDLGSPNVNTLRLPRTMILGGGGVSGNDVGEIWHLFDQRWDMELSIVETSRFNAISLDDYNTIIMVNGNYGDITSGSVEKLRRWIAGGGTLILHRSAVNWARTAGIAPVTMKSGGEEEDSSRSGLAVYTDVTAERGAQVIGGSIFRTRIDTTHPLFYGYRRASMPVFKNNTLMMEVPANRYAMPMQFDEKEPLMSGYISDRNLERLKGSAAVVVGGVGSGRVIMMTENPAFRAFWFGTNKILANSVFFGHTISGATLAR